MIAKTFAAERGVLSEEWTGVSAGTARMAKRAALVALGVALLVLAAKLRIPMWPVPITMQTFVVLAVGAAYGPVLGGVTMLAYLGLGALGLDVFTSSSADVNGLAYMLGATGGYLAGFLIAGVAMGLLARRGWDRSFGSMALAMAIGSLLIYVPGVAWLGQTIGWDKPVLDLGLYPFLLGDALKLALAALVFPALWRLVGDARA